MRLCLLVIALGSASGNNGGAGKWWEESHFAERVLNARAFGKTFKQVQAMIPQLQTSGYSVLNLDWPVEAGPTALYGGFGAKDFLKVDPNLGSEADWLNLVDAAHKHSMKIVSWFNPSYFWTGSPDFKQAEQDVKKHGVAALPATSPAHWFRWKASCTSQHNKPSDNRPGSFASNRWVVDPDAGGACYYSAWSDQPSGDFAKDAWRNQITKIFQHWVGTGLDGFMLDFPQAYLCSSAGCGADVKETIVDPVHALGAAVFGEVYKLEQPKLRAVLDASKDTYFDEEATSAISAGVGSGVEGVLTVHDALVQGGLVPRVNPGLYSGRDKGARTLAGAMGVLLGGYFVNGGSDYGDFTTWTGEETLSPLLRVAAAHPTLGPKASRRALTISSGKGGYACVRREGSGASDQSNTVAVVVLNLASRATTITVDLAHSGVVVPQTPIDLLSGAKGPDMPSSGSWSVSLPAHGYVVYSATAGTAPPSPPPAPASWTKHGGANCYNGAGAHDIDDDPCGQMSVAECKSMCTALPSCTGITVSQASSGGGHDCFRRSNVVVNQCDQNTEYDTYTLQSSQEMLV